MNNKEMLGINVDINVSSQNLPPEHLGADTLPTSEHNN